MLNGNDLFTIDLLNRKGETEITKCKIVDYNEETGLYVVSPYGRGTVLYDIREDQLTDISSLLPKEYQEVSYIQSSGTQYIDTDVLPTVNTGISIEYSYNTINSSNNAGISGIYQATAPRTDTLFVTTNSGKTDSTMILLHRGQSLNTGMIPTANTKYNAKINYLNDGKFSFNAGEFSGDVGKNKVISRNIILFGRDNNKNYAFSSARIYKCQMTEDEELIRDFIPCYRKADNEPGLYDLVNNVFYTNAGSGSFVVE